MWIVQINMNWLPNWPTAQFWALAVSTQTGICNVKTGASNLISKHHVLKLKKSLPKWWQFSSYSVDVYSWVNTKAEPHNLVNHPEWGQQPWWQSWKVWTHLHFGSQNNHTLFLLSKVGGITFFLIQSCFSSLDSCLLMCTFFASKTIHGCNSFLEFMFYCFC